MGKQKNIKKIVMILYYIILYYYKKYIIYTLQYKFLKINQKIQKFKNSFLNVSIGNKGVR